MVNHLWVTWYLNWLADRDALNNYGLTNSFANHCGECFTYGIVPRNLTWGKWKTKMYTQGLLKIYLKRIRPAHPIWPHRNVSSRVVVAFLVVLMFCLGLISFFFIIFGGKDYQYWCRMFSKQGRLLLNNTTFKTRRKTKRYYSPIIGGNP